MTINFKTLVDEIARIHRHFHAQAVKAVNVNLTLRNWLIGCYIREFELKGSDRASYGSRLLSTLEDKNEWHYQTPREREIAEAKEKGLL